MYPDVTDGREEQMLQLSGLQHFAFCRRQWALIHLEGQWAENLRTVEGDLFHARAHRDDVRERWGDTLIVRGLAVFSWRLGLSGKCDVVEFHRDGQGVGLHGEDGLWTPFPVEYKRGAPKTGEEDVLQLCAQAICLEEMLCCAVPAGALYYGETRRRVPVDFDEALRARVEAMAAEMGEYARRGHTPRAKPGRRCAACSLREICLPALERVPSASAYLAEHLYREDEA